MSSKYLYELAKTVRSKNAGVDRITFDIIFEKKKTYEHVCESNAITRETIAKLYGISKDSITDFVKFDPANAIKFTINRENASGGPGDSDIFGSQQYAPLLDIKIPV